MARALLPRSASAGESTGYLLVARNFPLDQAEEVRRFELDLLIQAWDQPVVEAQRPDELPLDLSDANVRSVGTLADINQSGACGAWL